MALPNIEIMDRDGAIREAEEAVAGDTRAAFFRKAAVGGGAVLSSGAIMGMLPELASAKPSKKQDVAILEFALTLEYLEAAFYKEAVADGGLTENILGFAKLTASHEATHVKTLKATIAKLTGKSAPKSPKFDFMDTNKGDSTFIATAVVLENTGVHAYLGQAGKLKSKTLLGAAASIVTIEARHASAIATIKGSDPFADGGEFSITPDKELDKPFKKSKVLAAAKPFIKS